MKFVYEKILKKDSNELVFLLAGRYQSASDILNIYKKSFNCNIIAIQPENNEWYPLPNGVNDQKKAALGIKKNLPKLHKEIKKIISNLKINKNKTSLIGFSAGGVMALELNAHNKKPFHSIVVQSGAIIRINKFNKSKNNTPILLIHNKDDDCFEWEERFIPMYKCLKKNKYNFIAYTKCNGKHYIFKKDVEIAKNFINF